MNYNEMFEFGKREGGFSLDKFLAANDSGVAEVIIPSEYKSLPVVGIGFEAFGRSPFIRSVIIPDSVCRLGGGAFRDCTALESVRVPGSIRQLPASVFLGCTALKTAELCEGVEVIGSNAFRKCTSLESIILPKNLRSIESCAFLGSPRLPTEIVMMGLACSVDYTAPFQHYIELDWENALRIDVFKLALKYGSFDEVGRESVLTEIVRRGLVSHLALAEQAGWLNNEERTRSLTDIAVSFKKAEAAAWLLDYQRRKFGFNGGNDLEL